MADLQNDLLLRVLRGDPVPRPPVWMMRQAGRYLPDFRALREQYSFFERCQTPELATQITLMPVEQIGVDAAIIFSDILVIPQALGFNVTIEPGEGPRIHDPIRTPGQVEALQVTDIAGRLSYVMEALRMTHKELGGRVPLIGFAGAPWTLLCYLIEGQGSRDFATAKAFCFEHPEAAQTLLQKLTDATVQYLQAQVAAGAQALQVFDSWANVLAPEDFRLLSLPSLRQIVQSGLGAPMILFARGAWHSLESLAATGADALSLDWTMDPLFARRTVGAQITLQGNLDPARLLSPPDKIHELTEAMIRRFGSHRYIANLGHGILPNTPVDHAKAFVEAVQSFED